MFMIPLLLPCHLSFILENFKDEYWITLYVLMNYSLSIFIVWLNETVPKAADVLWSQIRYLRVRKEKLLGFHFGFKCVEQYFDRYISIYSKNINDLNKQLLYYRCDYRSGTANSNTVKSKLHLIQTLFQLSAKFLSLLSLLKNTVNSNFHLIRRKNWPTNDFELTVSDL